MEKKIILALIGTVLLMAVGFSVWFFAIRDTWEQDHAAQLLALHRQAAELKANDNLPAASAQLHEILALVGQRNLKDDDLRSLMDDTRTSSQEIDRLLILKAVPKHLQEAADLLAADKVEESRSAYQAVLDALSTQGTSAPDTLRAAESAREGLRQVDVRQKAIAAARSRAEADRAIAEQRKAQEAALAKQREEDATRNAKIHATVCGGAWSVKGGGSSDLLRGMKVYLLKADCSGTTIRQCYQQVADISTDTAASWRKAAKEYRETPDEFGIWKKGADKYDADAKAEDEYAATVISDAKKVPDRMDVCDAYRAIRRAAESSPFNKTRPTFPLGKGFASVVHECAQKTVQASIDGKFSFDGISGGRYYLYAYWSTEFSSIEWLVPINVKESGTISQDLFNDTAEIIWNKD